MSIYRPITSDFATIFGVVRHHPSEDRVTVRPVFILSIATVERQCTPLSIATVVSLVAIHFLCQSLTAALRWYHCQPLPAVAVPVNGCLLFVCRIAPYLIYLPLMCD
jgi:hypothetical protein